MPYFRKRPVVIEAHQFHKDAPGNGLPPEFQAEICSKTSGKPCRRGGWMNAGWDFDGHIHTLEGILRFNDGEWIIKGVVGEFYACKPDVFDLTYEPAGERVS